MADMNQEIAEAIKKNLPLQIGEALQQELAALAKYRAGEADAKRTLELARASMDEAIKDRDGMRRMLGEHDAINKREAAVREREAKQDLRDLEVKLSELRRADAVGLVYAIFKSPVYRETVSGMVPVAQEGSPGGGGQYPSPGFVGTHPTSSTTTRETD